jgi:tetratricopeptide (TPR) repeat protein
MLEAVGNLSSVVAYSAFDISNYSAADRCFEFSLWCADQSGSWPLRANTLAEMSRKAAYLGNLDDALSLIEFAQVRADRVSATARAMMWTIRALLLASTGRHTEARSDIARADACFHDRDPDADPPWLTYYDLAEHQGSIGKALIPIAQAEKHVEPAAARLESAIQLHRQNYPRSRAFSRARLATLMMDIGDPQEAASIGRQAVDEAAPLRSDRITKELHNLAEASRPYSRMSDVSDLRNDIVELTQLEV